MWRFISMLHPLLSPSQTHYHAFGGNLLYYYLLASVPIFPILTLIKTRRWENPHLFPLLLLPSSSISAMSWFPLTEFPDFKGLFYLLFPFPLLPLGHLQYYKMFCRVPRISANVLPGQNAMMVCWFSILNPSFVVCRSILLHTCVSFCSF